MANETAEQKIYNRLAEAPSFHPAGAKLFVPDWTLDPGDVVTVQSDGEDYSVPIYSLDLTWNGQSRVDIQSTGNQKREPLSALRRKEYSAGRRGYGWQKDVEEEFQEFETWQEQTDETIGTYAGQFVEILGDGTNPGRLEIAETAITQTASDATITAQASGILLDEDGHPILDEHGHYQYDPNAGDTTLTARINTNATNISAKVSQTDLNTTLASYLQINEFSTELASTLDDGDSTLAAKVITLVNKNTNTSTVIIEADQIDLNGVVTSSQMDTRLLNADSLFASTGYAGTLYLTGNTSGTAISANGKITAGSVMATSMQAGSFRITTGDETYAEYTGKAVKVGNYSVPNVNVLANLTGSLTSVDLPDAISEITTTGYTPPTDGNIGFRYRTVGNSTYQQVNFNIADTAYYQSHVGIAANGVSVTGGTTEEDYEAYNDLQVDAVTVDSDGYYIVVATAKNGNHAYSKFHVPQGQATTPLVTKGTWSNGQITFTAGTTGTATASVDLGISVASVEDQQTPNRHARVTVNDSSSPTGETQELFLTYTSWDYPSAHQRRIQLRSGSTSGSVVAYADVDATDMYEDGWGNAEDICEPPLEYSGTAEKTNFSVQIPSSTVGNSTTYDFTIGQETPSASNKWAYVNYSNSGTDSLVAKINISGWYTAGQGSVSAVLNAYTGTIPSGTTPFSLSTGNYGLYLIKDGTTETDPISYYNVPSGGSVTYVVSSSGDTIPVFDGITVVGRLYPNTDVTLGSGTQFSRRQISYNGRSGYVGTVTLSTSKGPTNYTGHIGWTDEVEPGASRSVSSLSEVRLDEGDTGESTHSVDVTYDDGNTEIGGATITIDASAISGGGGGGSGGVDYVSKYQESDDSDDWASWDEALQDKITLNSDGTYAYLKVHANDGSVYNLGINASAVYQQGKSDGSGQIVYGSISNLALYTDSTTGHTLEYNETTKLYTAHIEVTGTNISNAPYHQNLNISGSAAYLQGKREGGAANVTISSISGTDIGNPSTNVNPGTIVATASNGNTGSEYLYLTQGNWNSDNRKAVNIRVGSTNGPLIARTWIDAPSGSHNITAGSVSVQTGSTSGRKSAGSISGQSVYNARNSGYIFFTASCGGTSQGFYISINA